MIRNNNFPKLYKYLDKCSEGGFYNITKLLTFQRILNFIVGSRSIGKSTAVACLCILNYIINGKMFIYCRRTKDEVLLTCRSFFDNAVKIINTKCKGMGLPVIKCVEYKAGKFYIQIEGKETDEQCGYCIPLSLEQKHKSATFSEYNIIIYDEFIATDNARYLGNVDYPDREYDSLMSLFQTVDRGIDEPFRDETIIICMGNNWSKYNPIFLSLNISDYIEDNSRWIKPKDELWILHNIGDVAATKDAGQHSNAYLLANQKLRDYAFNNISTESTEYIKKPDPSIKVEYYMTLKYDGREFGVLRQQDNFYIGKPRKGQDIVALHNRDHFGSDLKLLTSWREEPIMMILIEAYKKNNLYFATGLAKNEFLKYFKLAF